MMTLVNAEVVARLRQAARRFPDARLIVLFGSVATDRALSWSDADIAVSGVDLWRGLELGGELGSLLGREPHVVELETASDWLRYNVARDGVLLHEGEPFAWARFQAGAALVYFDLAPVIAMCAEGVRRRFAERS